jgi:hypothetical protein
MTMGEEKDIKDGRDFFVPLGTRENGDYVMAHHRPDHSWGVGVMRPMKEGVPIPEEAVLVRKKDGENVWEAEESIASLKKGPSKVVSQAYRSGYDRIFGPKDSN